MVQVFYLFVHLLVALEVASRSNQRRRAKLVLVEGLLRNPLGGLPRELGEGLLVP